MSIRSLVSGLIGVVAVLILLALTPHDVHAPKGIVLPATQVTHAAISPRLVKIYHQAPFGDYQVLAHIRAEVAFQKPMSKSQQALMQYVKRLAAGVGANGVIVQALVPDDGVQKAYTFLGTAISTAQLPATGGQ